MNPDSDITYALHGLGIIPLWLKISYTVFVAILVPIYWVRWGPANFLWFSDIALLLTVPALWLENSLLASMMAVSVMVLELAWNVDYFVRLASGVRLIGLADYMFDPSKSLFLRSLSLFHVFLPPLLLWMVYRLSYDPRALFAQTALCWTVLMVCYLFTDPSENINWAFGTARRPQIRIWHVPFVFFMMIGLTVVIYLPTHFVLQKCMPRYTDLQRPTK
jgi:hypothetical protein